MTEQGPPFHARFTAAELLDMAEALDMDVRRLYELRLSGRKHPALHENVRQLMDRDRWSGATIAREIGLKQPALHRRLSGKVEFSASEVLAIARTMRLDVRELYGLSVPERPRPATV